MHNNSSLEKHGTPFIPALRPRFASKEGSGRGLPGGKVKNNDGFAVIWLLVLIPLFLITVSTSIGIVQAVTGSDIDLQRAVELAAKAAAMQVTEESQAAGEPFINAAAAHLTFRSILAENIGLNADMTPKPGSMAGKAPDYVLVVYNGYDTYAPEAPAGHKFSFIGGVLTEQPLSGSGFPATFFVDRQSIVAGAGEPIEVTLNSPGVIAVANYETVEIVGNKTVEPARWAAARVLCPGGGCRWEN